MFENIELFYGINNVIIKKFVWRSSVQNVEGRKLKTIDSFPIVMKLKIKVYTKAKIIFHL